jgi:hypothetical protein
MDDAIAPMNGVSERRQVGGGNWGCLFGAGSGPSRPLPRVTRSEDRCLI